MTYKIVKLQVLSYNISFIIVFNERVFTEPSVRMEGDGVIKSRLGRRDSRGAYSLLLTRPGNIRGSDEKSLIRKVTNKKRLDMST